MKRIILFVVVIAIGNSILASDRITLRNGVHIDVKIKEIESDSVSFSYDTNATSLKIPLEDIANIECENGIKMNFNSTSSIRPNTQDESSMIENLYTSNISQVPISRFGPTYYLGDKPVSDKEYINFLCNNCSLAYLEYKKGRAEAISGWVLLGIGGALDVGFSWWVPYVWIPALACELACIPTLIVGYRHMHNSVDIYNSALYKSQIKAYWSINASQNGIGLALHF